MQERLFIVEISEKEIKAVAQGLHVLLVGNPEHSVTSQALTRLIQQSPVTYRDPSSHNVYPTLSGPSNAVTLDSVCYVPIK